MQNVEIVAYNININGGNVNYLTEKNPKHPILCSWELKATHSNINMLFGARAYQF